MNEKEKEKTEIFLFDAGPPLNWQVYPPASASLPPLVASRGSKK
jgi:hypothetical protein